MELQQVMWTTNAGLTDRHTYDSRPDSWPRLRRGIVSALLVYLHRRPNKFPATELLGQGSSTDLSHRKSYGVVFEFGGGIRLYCSPSLPYFTCETGIQGLREQYVVLSDSWINKLIHSRKRY
jgi:hypothetical protein